MRRTVRDLGARRLPHCLLKAGKRLIFIRENLEKRDEFCREQYALDPRLRVHELQRAPRRLDGHESGQERPEPRAVHPRDVRHVDQHAPAAPADCVVDLSREGFRLLAPQKLPRRSKNRNPALLIFANVHA